jgi:hypothetical protein
LHVFELKGDKAGSAQVPNQREAFHFYLSLYDIDWRIFFDFVLCAPFVVEALEYIPKINDFW